jgi:ATP-binding protein involved in chromosome partitioning
LTQDTDEINPFEQRNKQMEHVKQRMGKIKHKIAIISGKGGVGKSLVTVNLGVGLSMKEDDGKVGVLDADLTGPTIPKMMGLKGKKLEVGPPGIFPADGPEGVKVVSMDFLLPNDEAPVIWRGPLKMGAIRQFLGEVAWGDLEFLLVDLPPGTGDEPLSILQLLPEMDGVVIVTIPSEVSEVVVRKAVTFARKMNVPILGIIENMSGMVCPHCGEEIEVFSEGGGMAISEDMDVEFLGSIPIDPRVSSASDEGVPFIIKYPEAPASKSFMKIIEKIEEKVKKE